MSVDDVHADTYDTAIALRAVVAERRRQDAKWGEQNHPLTVWMTVLMEEVGEAAEAILHLREGITDSSPVRDELVQVAAVAVAAIEFIDRNPGGPM